jgi:putative flippase GtrA
MVFMFALIPAAFRAFLRMVFFTLLFVVLGAGIALLVAYANTPHWHWPPSTLTIVVAAVIGVLAGYAAGLTTLVREVVRGVKDVEHTVVKDVEGEREHAHA